MLASLIGRLIAVALLRAGPQHMPYSVSLMAGMYLSYFASSVLVIYPSMNMFWAVVEAVVDLAFLSLFVYNLLMIFNKRDRFVQTVTTLSGVSVLIQLVAWPLFIILQGQPAGDAAVNGVYIVLLLLLFWQLMVYAHVFRYAFEISMLRSAALSLLYLFLSVLIVGMVVPPQ
jgi:hypothetical protein